MKSAMAPVQRFPFALWRPHRNPVSVALRYTGPLDSLSAKRSIRQFRRIARRLAYHATHS